MTANQPTNPSRQNGTAAAGRRNRLSIRHIAAVGVLTALSTVLMFLEFSVPLVPAFLKFDFSDLPALIASFGFGPWAGVLVELIKNLIHLPMTNTGGVGELANFLLGSLFVLPAGLVYQFMKHKKGAIIGAVVGTLMMAAASLPVNYFLTYPVYYTFMPEEAVLGLYQAINPAATTLWRALVMFNVPFTIVKGLISVIITFLLYKKISPLLHGKK